MKPSHEVPTEIPELIRMSVLETLQPDFYHSGDEHAEAAIDLHKTVAKKYPNFYVDVFTDEKFTDYFLDAHKIISLPYILQDERNIDSMLMTLFSINVTRLSDIYKICRMPDVFGTQVPKSMLRKLFTIQTKHIENEKNAEYVGYIGVKYSQSIKDIMASIRVRKKELSNPWQEVMEWVFDKQTDNSYHTTPLIEAAKLRKAVLENKSIDRPPRHVPFTIWHGYAKALGIDEKRIFQQYKLMTNNEVRRNLATLQKHGILEQEVHRKQITEKVKKVDTDVVQLFYGIKVLQDDAKEILLAKGKDEYEKTIEKLKEIIGDKKISVAIDCSGGCAGFTNLLNPEMQKKIIKGEEVPKWAKIVQRESFNVNVLLGKVLHDSAKSAKAYIFNETAQHTQFPETFEQLVEELKHITCGGGSNILEAVTKATSDNPDIAFIISDINENIPFQGALKLKIEEIAKSFNGIIIFIVTETIVERPTKIMLDELIKNKKLHNVYIMPVNRMKQLEKGFMLLKLVEEAKKVFVKKKKRGE